MNKRQVTILWVIAIALGAAVATVKISQKQSTSSTIKRSRGQTLFESFPATETTSVDIQGATDSVTLTKKDGKWKISQRDDYPANNTFANDFIRTLGELKVTLALEAGPSFAPRFGMDEAASKPADHGLTASFKDASGKEIAKVSLGKNIENGAESSPMGAGGAVGRYVRNHADESGFYAVHEMFSSISSDPKRWLDSAFINPEKIKSITVSALDKSDAAWKLTRDADTAEFKLDGASPTEVLDTTATNPLKSIFSYARFDDVVPVSQVATRAATIGKRNATLETFDGFTYTIHLTPAKTDKAKPAPSESAGEPPASEQFLLTVDVTAELAKERKKDEGEKPEDAKSKDMAFAEQQKTLAEKLTKEKAFSGITFEVTKSTVEALLKERATLLTKATPTPSADAKPAANVQKFPGGMIARPPVTATTPPIEAVTPPISVPPAEDEPKK
jgi:hypothetical protein